MSSNIIGRTVIHPSFGEGIVLQERWKGEEYFVQFRGRLKVWLPSKEMQVSAQCSGRELPARAKLADFLEAGFIRTRAEEGKKAQDDAIPPVDAKASEKVITASGRQSRDLSPVRRMIEAFRIGVVPHLDVESFTFGRDIEIGRIDEAFSDQEEYGGSALVVEGEYGSGKTHFLDYIRSLALKRGYAVARAELDNCEVTPYKPKRIYRELMRSFSYLTESGEIAGFRDFMRTCGEGDLPKEHDILSPALCRTPSEKESVWQWLEGEEVPLRPCLYDHSTCADIYCYTLSGLGALLRKKGIKGLVILIDEAETLFCLWDGRERLRGMNFTKGLVLTTLNKVPSKPRIKRDNPGDLYYEDFCGIKLLHSGMRPLPYLYEEPSNIFLILAFTPRSISQYADLLEFVGDDRRIELSTPERTEFEKMFYRLVKVYEEAFIIEGIPAKTKTALLKAISDHTSLRRFIKATVEGLDLLRHHPGIPPKELFRNGR